MLSVDIAARIGTFELQPAFAAGSELVVLFGPSGSGKSLTLASVAGLLRPDSGRIVLPGGVVAFDREAGVDLPPQKRGLGYVVQDLALFPHMTAEENIAFPIASWQKAARAERVAHLIGLLGMEGFGQRRPAHPA